MSKLGLVFAGGGGKGAYQIGFWRALWEYGLEKEVCTVSGTSVGALNAALFAQGDLSIAECVWENLSPQQILFSPTTQNALEEMKEFFTLPFLRENYYHCLFRGACPHDLAAEAYPLPRMPQALAVSAGALPLALRMGRSTLREFAANRLAEGIISNQGLGEIIDQALDFSRLSASAVRCYATCCRIFPGSAVDRYLLGSRDVAFDRSVLLASAAIPIFFPAVQVDNRFYWDGGIPKLGENVPVAPAAQDGCCSEIIVVHLREGPPTPQGEFPEHKIIDLFPSQPLGGTAATFDFTARGARFRLNLGYQDGLALLTQHFPT